MSRLSTHIGDVTELISSVTGKLDSLLHAPLPNSVVPFVDQSRTLLLSFSRSSSLSTRRTNAVLACLRYAYQLMPDSGNRETDEEKAELANVIESLEAISPPGSVARSEVYDEREDEHTDALEVVEEGDNDDYDADAAKFEEDEDPTKIFPQLSGELEENDQLKNEAKRVDHDYEPHVAIIETLEAPSPECEEAFLTLAREALLSLDRAEFHVLSGRRKEGVREFHSASILLKVLGNLFGIPPSLEHKMEYADWRSHVHSRFRENLVAEHVVDPVQLTDVYTVLDGKQLGSGSYGTVVKVRHKKTKQVFACKALPVKRLTPHFLNKVHAEIEIMKEIDHPSITRPREVFFMDRNVYLIMDLCEGGELFQLLTSAPSSRFQSTITSASGRGFREEVVRIMLVDMLSALRFIHQRGIVHRDLKLENFLFDQPPTSMETLSLRLIDFGLSKYFAQDECIRNVVGSSYYMAPEVMEKNYNHKCDLWSLGVITYMLLSGMPPFRGKTDKEISRKVKKGRLTFPSSAFAHVSDEAIDFIESLLDRDVDRRFDAPTALSHPFITGQTFDELAAEEETEEETVESISTPRRGALDSEDRYSFLRRNRGSRSLIERQNGDESPSAFSDYSDTSPSALEGRDRASTLNASDAEDLKGSLEDFCTSSRMKRLMLEVVAFSCTPNEIRQLRETFLAIDTDKSGTISLAELHDALGESESLSAQDVESLYEQLGRGDREEINYTEFLAATMFKRIQIDDDKLRQAFEMFDKNGNGLIELSEVLEVVGADMSEEDVADLIRECDSNGDGMIDYNEFATHYREQMEEKELKPLKKLVNAVSRVSMKLGALTRLSVPSNPFKSKGNEEKSGNS